MIHRVDKTRLFPLDFSDADGGGELRRRCAGSELLEQIRHAARAGEKVVRIAPGNYCFPGKTGILLENLCDIVIEAEEEAKPRGTGLFAAGLLDERGSYVVLTEEEVAAVARDVEEAGRLTLQDIVRIANSHVQAPVPVQEEEEEHDDGGGEDAEC